jgi:NO-binding membrane sensor protein with MHYT domain
MTILSQLRYGPVTPVLAAVMATAGCLLGAMLTARGRRLTGRARLRSLAYATAAIGTLGLWLPQLIALLGVEGGEVSPRFSTDWLAAGLGAAVVLSGVAVFVAGTGWLTRDRIVASGALLGLAAVTMHLLGLRALQLLGTVRLEPLTSTAAAVGALLLAVAGVRVLAYLHELRRVVATAVCLGVAVVAAHYVAMSTVDVVPLEPSDAGQIPSLHGLNAIELLAPTVLVGIGVLFLLIFFTFGNSSRYNIMAIYDTSLDIDSSRVVAEITARLSEPAPDDEADDEWASRDSVALAAAQRAQFELAASEAAATRRGRSMAAAVIARAAALTDAAGLRAPAGDVGVGDLGVSGIDLLEPGESDEPIVPSLPVVVGTPTEPATLTEPEAQPDIAAGTEPGATVSTMDDDASAVDDEPVTAELGEPVEAGPAWRVVGRAQVAAATPAGPSVPESLVPALAGGDSWPAFGRKEIWAPLAGYPVPASGRPASGLPSRAVPLPAQPRVEAEPVDRSSVLSERRRDPINRDPVSPILREPVGPGRPRPRPSARPDWSNVPRWGEAAPIDSPQPTNSMRYPPEPAAEDPEGNGRIAVARKTRRGNRGH